MFNRQIFNHFCFKGLPTFARTWKIEKDATLTGSPPVKGDGEAAEGVQTRTPGLLSYPEVCGLMLNAQNKDLKGEHAPLRKISDPTKRYGSYAFRLGENKSIVFRNFAIFII